MDNRGYTKTLEAILAIIIVLVVVYITIPKNDESAPEVPLVVEDAQRFIISGISNNDSLRASILTSSDNDTLSAELGEVIESHVPPNYDFVCAICPNTNPCIMLTPLEKSVYMSDVFIASTLGPELVQQNPKIVRFWMWLKPTKDLPIYNVCQVI